MVRIRSDENDADSDDPLHAESIPETGKPSAVKVFIVHTHLCS
jgi:hypothetical protein